MANELKRSKQIIIDRDLEKQINPINIQLLKKYKRDMEIRGLADGSIYGYERDILSWMAYLVREQFNPSVKDITEDDIEEFIYFCKTEGNNTERIKRRMSSISAFYKFLRKKKEISENPMEFMSRPKRGLPVVVQTFLTHEQVELMRAYLEKENDIQLTTYAELSLATMARVNAICNMTWEQFNFEDMLVEDVLEKEGKIRTLFYDERVRDLLVKLKQSREEEGIDSKYLFVSKYEDVYDKVENGTLGSWAKKIGSNIGVPTLHPHDFRHSQATLLKNSGMDLETVSFLLGHEGTDVTRKFYIKTDSKKMAELYRQFKK